MLGTIIAGGVFAVPNPATDFKYDFNEKGDGVIITSYVGNGTAVEIPATIERFPVMEIGSEAFSENSKLTSITIPNSVTSIGYSAFRGCESLTSVTLPDGLVSIGAWAFIDCFNIKKLTIPASVTDVGISAFGYAFSDGTMYYGLDPEVRDDMVKRFGIEIFDCPF
jgi:hypothetical protein